MRFARPLIVVALASGLVACGVSVSDINKEPKSYYQEKVSFRGRIARMQVVEGETLLEIADNRESRILASSEEPVEYQTGDWVRVKGILVPEARVGGTTLYDVVVIESIRRSRSPRFRNLF